MPAWLLRVGELDERLLHAVLARRRPPMDTLARGLTRLGDASVSIAMALILLLGVVPGLQDAGKTAAFSLAFSHLLVQILKRSFARPRPFLPVGIRSLIKAPDHFSFPSGHAAAALSISLAVALSLPSPEAYLLLGLGLGVGVTRCYLGVHYPGDVLAGWGLALFSTLLAGPVLALLP
jgi:undecaprenyl-diphosphatase